MLGKLALNRNITGIQLVGSQVESPIAKTYVTDELDSSIV